MIELTTTGYWHELQTKLRIKYPDLTETDLAYQEPLQQDMLRIVEYKLGKTKAEMKKIITGL
jgi:hypothetical protein